jgi:pimeloyl-ACP methyl ester carboxylesterase
MLAASRGDLIAAAALNDVGPEVGAAGLARIAAYVGTAPAVSTWAEAGDYCRSIMGPALPDWSDWDGFARRTFREVDGRIEADYDPAIAQIIKATPPPAPDAPQPTLWPLFTALSTGRPLLVVRGSESDILEAATSAKMAEAAPHMQVVDIPGVGHAPTLEEPAALEGLVGFLETAP